MTAFPLDMPIPEGMPASPCGHDRAYYSVWWLTLEQNVARSFLLECGRCGAVTSLADLEGDATIGICLSGEPI